jgi:hypothetical protein
MKEAIRRLNEIENPYVHGDVPSDAFEDRFVDILALDDAFGTREILTALAQANKELGGVPGEEPDLLAYAKEILAQMVKSGDLSQNGEVYKWEFQHEHRTSTPERKVSEDNEVAKTILQQLGGNKFIAMTGAKHFVARNDANSQGISFRIGLNKSQANYVKIALNSMDTYDMEFGRVIIKGPDVIHKIIKTVDGAYAEDLQRIFTEVTGMATHL